MAYRVIGLTARMCLELGLHRRDALKKSFPDEDQWSDVSKIFWSIYSLDRRWSLGTGLPFVIQDEDIDSNLPEPVRHYTFIFLSLLMVIGFIVAIPEVYGFVQSNWLQDLVFRARF